MNNRNCAANEAAYVTLKGRWICGGCGCVYQGGNSCVRCGWNGSGCYGGLVRTGDHCRRARNGSCCAETDATTAQQGCAARIRREEKAAACAEKAVEASRCGTPRNRCIRQRGCADAAAETCECSGCDACMPNGSVNEGVGMVYAVEQQIERLHGAGHALRSGTLFPELHKPMDGYAPCDDSCPDAERELAFAAWELRLYLNTHPEDRQALALFRRLQARAKELNYATAFMTCGMDVGWDWTDDPWPWENRTCCGRLHE